jgi:hypothetical protein
MGSSVNLVPVRALVRAMVMMEELLRVMEGMTMLMHTVTEMRV